MKTREIVVERPYLHLPIAVNGQCQYLKITANGAPIREYHLALAADRPDYYSPLFVGDWLGQTLCLSAEVELPLDAIVAGDAPGADNPLYPGLYRETLRPRFHFSPLRGWMNDPNGLVYAGEKYHLYFQHNPYGTKHGGVNIHWGHAVSDDCVHWRELDDALSPWDSVTHIASGNAIALESGEIVAAFTALGSMDYRREPPTRHPSRGQYLARSADGGNHFHLFPENPVISTRDGADFRDPFLIRTINGFYCAVYERDEESRNCVQFYHSGDLVHWVACGRAENLYECPNLFPLPIEGTNESKWVLFGADGMARFGTFDGAFHQEGAAHPLDYGASTYAGQVWTNAPGGPIHIGWMHGMDYEGQPFSQCMTVPCRLTLSRGANGLRLARNPIKSIQSLRMGQSVSGDYVAARGMVSVPLQSGCDAEFIIRADGPIDLLAGKHSVRCDLAKSVAYFKSGTVELSVPGELRLRALIDRTTAELFFDERAAASYALDTRDFQLCFTSASRIEIRLRAWEMSSALPL